MNRSGEGSGSGVANAMAYRSEHVTAKGQLKQIEAFAVAKKCETPWI
jgi:hypothetical protein